MKKYAIAMFVALSLLGCDTSKDAPSTPLPDFAAITDVQTKKSAFFDYFSPLVASENQRVSAERDKLVPMAEKYAQQGRLSRKEFSFVAEMAEKYQLPFADNLDDAWFEEMLLRVDTIPAPLVLVQAAKESGWGTSRFAKEGFNYFGQWCYKQGCGLVPSARSAGASHEVAVFASPADSVSAYFLNLNRNRAYKELRDIRATLDPSTDTVTQSKQLTLGLQRYSERGMAYVNDIQAMLRQNKRFFANEF
ncbi:glucosaminidase domain-containing protein [Thaumasiovibrio subtropicus]|uniref:glucosaminidase domain-containing protein n=1 Tax=Thaumasiovibrio subtropicus TaxID=1891207 RepID=UPI000B356449|nr:glucosaminidase domain-containing protein [Thaumasiovibrio subtropicus]